MRVISFINGSLISENASLYALRYATQMKLKIDFIHVEGKDSLSEVQKSAKKLISLADSFNLENRFLLFDSFDAAKEYLMCRELDVIFCASRHNHSFFDKSFAQTLLKANIKTDLAIVKILKLSMQESVDKLIMPIRDSKLSVRKFSFYSAFTLAYNAEAEIYSLDKFSKTQMANLSIAHEKKRLQEIIFNLKHYIALARMMHIKFSIKHNFALLEDEKVTVHIVKNNYDLAIIGGHHDKTFFGHHPIDILFETPVINTIFFIPYKDQS